MGKRGSGSFPDVLTPRESDVLALVREGLTNEQISERLGISPNGVKYHVSQILSKLGVGTRAEAAAWQPDSKPWWSSAIVFVGWPLKHLSWSVGVKGFCQNSGLEPNSGMLEGEKLTRSVSEGDHREAMIRVFATPAP